MTTSITEVQVKNKLDKVSIKKIAKGAGIAGSAVIIIYVLEALTALNFGQYTALIVGVCSILLNAIKEWRKETKVVSETNV